MKCVVYSWLSLPYPWPLSYRSTSAGYTSPPDGFRQHSCPPASICIRAAGLHDDSWQDIDSYIISTHARMLPDGWSCTLVCHHVVTWFNPQLTWLGFIFISDESFGHGCRTACICNMRYDWLISPIAQYTDIPENGMI